MNRFKVIEMVRSTQAHLLEPGEEYLTVAQVNRRPSFLGGNGLLADWGRRRNRPNPPGLVVPDSAIVAATQHRLLIWSTDPLNRRIREPIASLVYGTDLQSVRVTPKSEAARAPSGKTYVDLVVRGVVIETEMKVTAADELARILDDRLPPMSPGWAAPTG